MLHLNTYVEDLPSWAWADKRPIGFFADIQDANASAKGIKHYIDLIEPYASKAIIGEINLSETDYHLPHWYIDLLLTRKNIKTEIIAPRPEDGASANYLRSKRIVEASACVIMFGSENATSIQIIRDLCRETHTEFCIYPV